MAKGNRAYDARVKRCRGESPKNLGKFVNCKRQQAGKKSAAARKRSTNALVVQRSASGGITLTYPLASSIPGIKGPCRYPQGHKHGGKFTNCASKGAVPAFQRQLMGGIPRLPSHLPEAAARREQMRLPFVNQGLGRGSVADNYRAHQAAGERPSLLERAKQFVMPGTRMVDRHFPDVPNRGPGNMNRMGRPAFSPGWYGWGQADELGEADEFAEFANLDDGSW